MAQFSSLEQMSNINKEMRNLVASSKSSEAYGMLGKEIEAYSPANNKKIQGIVSSVFFKGEDIMLTVGGEEVSMKYVHSVAMKEKKNAADLIKNLPVYDNTKK